MLLDLLKNFAQYILGYHGAGLYQNSPALWQGMTLPQSENEVSFTLLEVARHLSKQSRSCTLSSQCIVPICFYVLRLLGRETKRLTAACSKVLRNEQRRLLLWRTFACSRQFQHGIQRSLDPEPKPVQEPEERCEEVVGLHSTHPLYRIRHYGP